ncbi:ATP-binding protein [Flammeovirga sp. OC4]|uniref:sensor histidine kinase n=1 Tax=Flammeovirga sp. OC4 TaxID=1382345 RepID=UPI00155DDA8E|nr:ATP-binding protein [Flammeovirga sp. OC4]
MKFFILLLPIYCSFGQQTFPLSESDAIDSYVEVMNYSTEDTLVHLRPQLYHWGKLPNSTYSLPPFSEKKWYRFKVASSKDTSTVLAFMYDMIPVLDIYVQSSLKSGYDKYPLGTNVYQKTIERSIELDFKKGESKTIYFKVFGNGGSTSSNPILLSKQNFLKEKQKKSSFLIICRTITIFFLVILISLYFNSKNNGYLYLCFSLIAIMLFAETESGALVGLFYVRGNDLSYFIRILGNHLLVIALFNYFDSILDTNANIFKNKIFIGINIYLILLELFLLLIPQVTLIWGILYTSIITSSYILFYFIIRHLFLPSIRKNNHMALISFGILILMMIVFFISVTGPHIGLLERTFLSSVLIYVGGILSVMMIALLIGIKVKQTYDDNRRLTQLEAQFQREYLEVISKSQQIERQKISNEINDKIGTDLLVVKKMLPPTNTTLKPILDDTILKVSTISKQLRNTSIHQKNWTEKISELTTQFSSKDIQYSFQNNAQNILLPNTFLQHIFLIINELFVNAAKHSKAQKVSISFQEKEGQLIIKYSDDGTGIEKSALKKAGIGIQNIKQRVKVMRGVLYLTNNYGLTVMISIPLH